VAAGLAHFPGRKEGPSGGRIPAVPFLLSQLLSSVKMSAIGPKRTCASAPHMSAFGGKADMTFCTYSSVGAMSATSGHPHCSVVRPFLARRLVVTCYALAFQNA